MKKQTINIIIIIIIASSIIGGIMTIYQVKTLFQERVPEENKMAEQPDIQSTPPEEQRQSSNSIKKQERENGKIELTKEKKVLIIVFCSLLSLSVIYIIMNLYDNKFYRNKDRIIIYILSNIIFIYLLFIGCTKLLIDYETNNHSPEENTPKDEIDLYKNEKIQPGKINLSDYNTDITITKSGTYELKGFFTNSIIVDAPNEEVELILAGVNIINENTATIIGLNAKKLTINSIANTENTLKDGGNSKYDGCIYSATELIFKGTGKLNINGNQNKGEGIATESKNIIFEEGTYIITSNDDGINAGGDGATITINGGTFYIDAEGDGIDSNKDAAINGGTLFIMGAENGKDAGIDTDEGYTINGGTVVAIGSDMIELPKKNSKQNSITFSLEQKIDKYTLVTLTKKDKIIVSFEAPKSFKTLIISSENLTKGEYELYIDGTTTAEKEYGLFKDGTYTKGKSLQIDGEDKFYITDTINTFGKIKK